MDRDRNLGSAVSLRSFAAGKTVYHLSVFFRTERMEDRNEVDGAWKAEQ